MPCKRAIFGELRPFPLPTRLTKHLHFQGVCTLRIDGSRSVKLQHWGYQVENDLFWNGFARGYEGTSLEIWRRLASGANVILDIGASTGIVALSARSLNPRATIIAFEPVERVFDRLKHNVELNSFDIKLEKFAASDVTGETSIFD